MKIAQALANYQYGAHLIDWVLMGCVWVFIFWALHSLKNVPHSDSKE